MRRIAILTLVLAVSAGMGRAQTADGLADRPLGATNGPQTNDYSSPSTAENFEQRGLLLLEQLNSATDLEADVRTGIQDSIRRAREEIAGLQSTLTESDGFNQRAAAVQPDSQTVTDAIAELRSRSEPQPPVDLLLPDLEELLLERQQSLAELHSQQQSPDSPQQRAARRKVLRDLLISLPKSIADAEQLLAEFPDAETNLTTQAGQFEAECRMAALVAQLHSVRNELALYDAEDAYDVARLRREKRRNEIAFLEREMRTITAEVTKRRRLDAQERVRQAEVALARASAGTQSIIAGPLEIDGRTFPGSLEIARDEVRLRQERERFVRQLEDAREEFDEVLRWHQQAQDRIDSLGPTLALGLRLRQQRALLPDIDAISLRRMQRLETIEQTQTSFLDYSEQLDEWGEHRRDR